MTCVTNYDAPYIRRGHIFSSSYGLRYRTEEPKLPGNYQVHGSPNHRDRFDPQFYTQISRAVGSIASTSRSSSTTYGDIKWMGSAGAKANKSGCHSTGSALDITAIQFDHVLLDMNVSWVSSQTLAQRRGYLAVWAGLRIYCATVLTNAYNPAHQDHIHVDNNGNGTSLPPALRTSVKTDTTLVQTSCNLYSSASLSIDGQWGLKTQTAYDNLLAQLGMGRLSPTTNYWAMYILLYLLMKNGFAPVRSTGLATYRDTGFASRYR